MKTQLPYALLAAVASLIGYVAAAITMNGVVSLVITLICMVVFLFFMHKLDVKKHPDDSILEQVG